MTLSPRDRARRCAEIMWSDDGASSWMGMEMLAVDEGTADFALTVAAHHANGHGICHGGVTFALADTAFAFACNSRNQNTLAQHNLISYLAPVHVGDRIVASAREVSLSGRFGIYDVTVTNQSGRRVAEFRGHSCAIRGRLFEESAPGETP